MLRPAASAACGQEDAAAGSGGTVSLGMYSSGSTGKPKLVWRPWSDLLREVRVNDRTVDWTWACSFGPETFAGVQVALQAWRSHGKVLSLGTDWVANWKTLNELRPAALSCTPTFLDLLLQFGEASEWSPCQITLGGEVLRGSAGQRFARRFPETRFTVIYASAEHGLLLKTHRLDGWYETAAMTRRDIKWRVDNEILEVQRCDRWVSTGDRVEVQGDLVRIVGRGDAVANIGGCKISLDEISRLAEQVAGVRRAAAFVEPNPVVGQIIGLKFAIEAGSDPAEVEDRLQQSLRRELRKEAWPRRWELDLVGLGNNSKRIAS